jgi:hypothetical protein
MRVPATYCTATGLSPGKADTVQYQRDTEKLLGWTLWGLATVAVALLVLSLTI